MEKNLKALQQLIKEEVQKLINEDGIFQDNGEPSMTHTQTNRYTEPSFDMDIDGDDGYNIPKDRSLDPIFDNVEVDESGDYFYTKKVGDLVGVVNEEGEWVVMPYFYVIFSTGKNTTLAVGKDYKIYELERVGNGTIKVKEKKVSEKERKRLMSFSEVLRNKFELD